MDKNEIRLDTSFDSRRMYSKYHWNNLTLLALAGASHRVAESWSICEPKALFYDLWFLRACYCSAGVVGAIRLEAIIAIRLEAIASRLKHRC